MLIHAAQVSDISVFFYGVLSNLYPCCAQQLLPNAGVIIEQKMLKFMPR